MTKYMKKPLIVEAFQMTKKAAENKNSWDLWLKEIFDNPKNSCALRIDIDQAPFMLCSNIAGTMIINPDDYIIFDKERGLYSYSSNVFESLYDEIKNVKITKINKSEEMTQVSNQQFLFFDTETSGFISKSKSFDDPSQAWCVQIGAILSTEKEIIKKLNVIIKANGREMNYHAEQIHGISVDFADEHGIKEFDAISQFAELMKDNPILVCHNFDFDWEFVYQLMQRNQEELSDIHRSVFYRDLPHICTMKDKKVKKYVNAKNVKGSLKFPKLIELHEKLFDAEFEDAHDAMADISATRKCFFKLIDKGIITI